MTRQFNDKYHCSACGALTTCETHFGRWIRNNARLDSVDQGLCFYDIDYVVHKYKSFDVNGSKKSAELIMLVEVKTRDSTLHQAQRDTLYILNQIIENRRSNRHSSAKTQNNRHRQSFGPLRVYSHMKKESVNVLSFGLFTLRFSHTSPVDSDWIKWNDKEITATQLEELLRFDINPITFKPMKEYLRNHHKAVKKQQQPMLPIDFGDQASNAITGFSN